MQLAGHSTSVCEAQQHASITFNAPATKHSMGYHDMTLSAMSVLACGVFVAVPEVYRHLGTLSLCRVPVCA